jgi:excisionase family DNA binding protein
METSDKWHSVEGIADYLGVSKETIYRWLDRGSIPAHRIGKLWKFKPSEVDNWVMSGGATTMPSDSKKHGNQFESKAV